MANVNDLPVEKQVSLSKEMPFIETQDVSPTDADQAAYTIEGPPDYLIGIDEGTPVAPEFRDANGDKLDGATRVIIQKADKQGNLKGDGIVFNETINGFDYAKMRHDPDFFRRTVKRVMVDEREILKILVDIPEGSNGFSAAESRITIGDETSDYGKPVEIVSHDDLTEAESKAVKQASTIGGN